MSVSRRTFLKTSLAGGLGASVLGFDLAPAQAAVRRLKIAEAREYKTICPYCAVGCGTIAYVHGSGGLNTTPTITHVEGDPDSPINGGTLCPKGAAQMQLAISPRLRKSPMIRDAGASNGERSRGTTRWTGSRDGSRRRATPRSSSGTTVDAR